MDECTLDGKTRELICIALLVFARCGPGVFSHTLMALSEGATKDEITDAMHLAFYEAATVPLGEVGTWVEKAFEKWEDVQEEAKGAFLESIMSASK